MYIIWNLATDKYVSNQGTKFDQECWICIPGLTMARNPTLEQDTLHIPMQ